MFIDKLIKLVVKGREQIIHIARILFNNSFPVHLGNVGVETISRKPREISHFKFVNLYFILNRF